MDFCFVIIVLQVLSGADDDDDEVNDSLKESNILLEADLLLLGAMTTVTVLLESSCWPLDSFCCNILKVNSLSLI